MRKLLFLVCLLGCQRESASVEKPPVTPSQAVSSTAVPVVAPAVPKVSEPRSVPAPSGCPDTVFYEVGGGIRAPIVTHRVDPEFSQGVARTLRVSGSILLQAFIDASGRVCAATILRGVHPSLDGPCIEALMKWKFKPAKLADRPVACVYQLTVNINLR